MKSTTTALMSRYCSKYIIALVMYLFWVTVRFCFAKIQILAPSGNLTINCPLSVTECGLDRRRKANLFPFSRGDLHQISFNLIDPNNRISMDWTPKAACTAAVKMFLDHMGVKEWVHYRGWVHDFRKEYYRQCGRGNSCIFEDPSWYKFKVVRNPFDRAVSSFIHVMKTPHAVNEATLLKLSGVPNKRLMTFKKFIHSMDPSHGNDGLLQNSHIRKQSLDVEYELHQNGRPSLFNAIVKVEDIAAGMRLVSQETGFNFHPDFQSSHYFPRAVNNSEYVGETPWFELQERGIPATYGHFYNDRIRARVARLFAQDRMVYNYTFPF